MKEDYQQQERQSRIRYGVLGTTRADELVEWELQICQQVLKRRA
jgi:hypothetical protein